MFKRIGLLILANLAIFIMLSVILTVVQMVFGINFGTMAGSNLNLGTLFIFAMVVGFSGSIISLLASKMMAKMTMGLTMIDVNNPRNRVEQYVVETVRKLANEAGLPMPEVAIYEGEPNAFATGPSRSNSLVAVKGYGLHLGAAAPLGAGTLTAGLYYTDATDEQIENKDVDFKYYGASARYNYPLSERTGVYAGAGYGQVKNDDSGDKTKVTQVYCGLVHTF